jgi:SET domain
MLLYNANPDFKQFSLDLDIPVHRVPDFLKGTLDTNCFGPRTSFGTIGALLLTGSLFNHSGTPNVTRGWDDKSEKVAFTSVRDIKEGDELEIDYGPKMFGVDKAERLRNYSL